MSAHRVEIQHGLELGEVVIWISDHGPEQATHQRYEAELLDYPVVREAGMTPWEAVHRLVSNHRAVLERRWSAWR